jgi:uncharacterized membrane protein YbhN (UPF0104 family)
MISIPISIGGLGIRELTLVYLFSKIGVTSEVSVSSGLLLHFIQIAVSTPVVLYSLLKSKS